MGRMGPRNSGRIFSLGLLSKVGPLCFCSYTPAQQSPKQSNGVINLLTSQHKGHMSNIHGIFLDDNSQAL